MIIPPEIERAIKTKQLILFIGAGYSCSSPLYLPSWRQLVEIFVEEIKKQVSNTLIDNIVPSLSAGVINEIYALDLLNKEGFKQRCLEILTDKIDLDFSGIDMSKFEKLWKITDKIITTNYDCAIESSKDNILTFSYSSKSAVAKLYNTEQYLFKMHGTIKEPTECVLFRDTYEDLYRNNKLAIKEISDLFSHKTVVFVGFGLTDPYVTDILEELQKLYEGNKGKHYVLTTNNEDFSRFDVETIKLANWNELDIYLDKLAKFKESVDYSFEELLNDLDSKGKTYDVDELQKKHSEYLKNVYNSLNPSNLLSLIEDGKYTEAESFLKESIEISVSNISLEKEKAAENYYNLSGLKELQLELKDALYFAQQAYLLEPLNIKYLKDYIGKLLNAGSFHESKKLLFDALKIPKMSKEENIDFKILLGRLLNELGEFGEALEKFSEVREFFLNEYGDNHIQTISIYNPIGTALRQLGKVKEAINIYERGVVQLIHHYPDIHLDRLSLFYGNLSIAWANLAWANNFDKDYYERSLKYAEDSLKLNLSLYGKNSLHVANDYNNIGIAQKRLNRFDLALDSYHEALNIIRTLYSEDHPRFLDFSISYCAALRATGKAQESIDLLTKILPKAVSVYGEKNRRVGQLYINMGFTHGDLGNYPQAVSYYEKGLPILISILGADNHHVKVSLRNYEEFKSKL